MPNRIVRASAVILMLAAAAACGTDEITTATESPSTSTAPAPTTSPDDTRVYPAPPPVRITGDGVDLSLLPWTYCWTEVGGVGVCADGSPPTDPEIARGGGPLEVDFPVADWWFEVSYAPAGGSGPPPGGTDAGQLLVRPDTSTTYDVTLTGRSAPGATPSGDLFVTFRWEP